MAEQQQTIPKLRVQRMGPKWRIVYDETRNLAVYGGGLPVDGGGFEDIWEDGVQVEDGRISAMKRMSEVIDGQQTSDPEEENIS